jgi:4-amino-4-deoxy-L-arabinose transferase-like glycosyltransferase
VKPPVRQRLRTLTSREHLAAVFARLFPRRIDRVLLACVIAAIVAGTVLRVDIIGTNNRISTDEQAYIYNAERILQDHPIATFKWAPGTSIMFAAAALVRGYSTISFSTHSHGVAQYSQLLTEMATLALVAAMAWLLAGGWAALLATVLMATYDPLIDVTRSYLSEPLGALALLAMMATVCWARRKDHFSLMLAGIVAGLAGLVREDLAIAVAVIMIGLLIDGRARWRTALIKPLLYGLVALATVTPYVIYASLREHHFTPIVSAGPNALFLGTYLPGGGNQFFDTEVLAKEVCAVFKATHPRYCHLAPGNTQGVNALLLYKHPGGSESSAAEAEALHNLDKYMLGRPLKFLHMLWKKAWNMWSLPWSGGNAGAGGGLVHSTSVFQHQLYSAIAWIGMLLGLVFYRRWAFTVPVLGLLTIALLNTFFAITPRDNVRFMPFVFLYGAAGLVATIRWALARVRSARTAGAVAAPGATT